MAIPFALADTAARIIDFYPPARERRACAARVSMHRISTSLSLSLTLSVCLSFIVARRKEQLELSQSPHIKKGRLLCLRIPIIIFLNEKMLLMIRLGWRSASFKQIGYAKSYVWKRAKQKTKLREHLKVQASLSRLN